jgi:hypothetical protein
MRLSCVLIRDAHYTDPEALSKLLFCLLSLDSIGYPVAVRAATGAMLILTPIDAAGDRTL